MERSRSEEFANIVIRKSNNILDEAIHYLGFIELNSPDGCEWCIENIKNIKSELSFMESNSDLLYTNEAEAIMSLHKDEAIARVKMLLNKAAQVGNKQKIKPLIDELECIIPDIKKRLN